MENKICNAYAYFFEFNKDFNLYLKTYSGAGYKSKSVAKQWNQNEEDYNTLSEYMSDEAIKQAWDFVINEL